MTTKAPAKLSLSWLTKNCVTLFGRIFDFHSFHAARLEAIENRLSQLDGRDDAKAARQTAVLAANIDRVAAGLEPLCFRLVETASGTQIEWTK